MTLTIEQEPAVEGEWPIDERETNRGYAEIADVLAMARAGQLRGLPLPIGLSRNGWYSTQNRPLADGTIAVYLMYRWRNYLTDKTLAMPLGRLI